MYRARIDLVRLGLKFDRFFARQSIGQHIYVIVGLLIVELSLKYLVNSRVFEVHFSQGLQPWHAAGDIGIIEHAIPEGASSCTLSVARKLTIASYFVCKCESNVSGSSLKWFF